MQDWLEFLLLKLGTESHMATVEGPWVSLSKPTGGGRHGHMVIATDKYYSFRALIYILLSFLRISKYTFSFINGITFTLTNIFSL